MSPASLRPAVLAAALVVACGQTDEVAPGSDTDTSGTSSTGTTTTSTTAGTKPWDEGSTTAAASTSTSSTSATSGSTTTGGDATTAEEVEEDFIGWTGVGTVEPGVSYSPEGEVVAFVNGVDECIVFWEGTAEPAMDCAQCDFAFTITVTQAAIEEEQGTGCADNGVDVSSIEGTVFGVGLVAPEDLYLSLSSGYALDDEAYGEVFDDQFEWAYPL